MKSFCCATILFFASLSHAADAPITFDALPPLPEALSGHFAGTIQDIVVVAGGTSYSAPPWEGGTRYWHNKVYQLGDKEPLAWYYLESLAVARAYGATVSAPQGIYLIGGTNGQVHLDDVMLLLVDDKRVFGISVIAPRLPAPAAYLGAAMIGNTIYAACGQTEPESGVASNALWSLDLNDPNAAWQSLEPMPGVGRISPAVAQLGNSLYVAGGASLAMDEDGHESRTYLSDVWRYTPGNGWSAAAPLPYALANAPNAAMGDAHWLLYGGDTGVNFIQGEPLHERHPGYSRNVLAYTPRLNVWSEAGTVSEAVVSAPAVAWKDGAIIVAGEDRPAHHTTGAYHARSVQTRQYLDWLDWTGIIVYLAAMLGIGFYFTGKEKSAQQFFLGSRRIPWWAVGLSIFGTAISSITYLSIPARAFATNWTMSFANIAIFFVAPIVVWFYIPRFRAMNLNTAYEYLERRFNFGLRVYGSLCFLLFQFGRISVVLFLPALALSETTGMSPTTSILLMGVLTTIYTVLGGIEAVIWTDVVQSFVLIGGAVLALVLVVMHVDGGAAEIVRSGMAEGKFTLFNPTWSYAADAFWVILIGNIFANFYPATADQTIVQRYLTTADEKSAARAVWTNALLTIPITALFFGLGTALWAYFRQHPLVLPPGMRNDAVLPVFMMAEFPSGARGILISGLFAAAMSSLSSSMNSIASVMINDYYKRFIQPGVSDRAALRLAQGITLFFGMAGTAASLYIAKIEAVSLWDPFLELLGLAGGGLAGIFALGIFVKRANGKGAMIGAVASGLVLYFVKMQTPMNPMLFGMVGFLTALIVGWVASLAFKPQSASA